MPYKLTSTLLVLFFFGCILNLIVIPRTAYAQMSTLSEIQNGVFFLSHKNTIFTPETFNNDRYIDEDQADFFADATTPEINTPPDENYPFTLVDHYILDSDLEIQYRYDKVLCSAYPKTAYLSRHNIPIADYTDQNIPPEVFFEVVKGREPFHKDKVKAITWEFNNYKLSRDEYIHNYSYSDCKVDGYMINTSVHIKTGIVAVWTGETYSLKYLCPPNNAKGQHPHWHALPPPWRNYYSKSEHNRTCKQIKNYPESRKNTLSLLNKE